MELLGRPGDLVSPRRFVDQGRDHENIDPFKVFVWVDQAGAVFKPDLALVDIRAFPLGEGTRKE